MSRETNKAIARRWSEELWSAGLLYVADAIIAPGYVQHDPADPVPVTGPAGVKRLVTMVRSAIPDLCITVEALISEGDQVVTRCTINGTVVSSHAGAATRTGLCVTAILIFRVIDGKITESWTNRDDLGMWQQLDLLPPRND